MLVKGSPDVIRFALCGHIESSPAPANKKRKAASPKGGRRGKRRRQVEEDWDDSEEEEEEDGGSFSAGEMRSLYDALRELLRVSSTTLRYITGLILDLRPANERQSYFVTTSLIGWAQA